MTHTMHLAKGPFELIRSGRKTIELRLYDEKRRTIRVGDVIVFDSREQPGASVSAVVRHLYCFADFRTLYASLPLQKCGYSPEEAVVADPDDMLAYYSSEQVEKYGVVGIEIELC